MNRLQAQVKREKSQEALGGQTCAFDPGSDISTRAGYLFEIMLTFFGLIGG